MTQPRLTLYTGSRNLSSWSLRAWLALKLTGLPFEEIVFDLEGPERAQIPSVSPSGAVPCLKVQEAGRADLLIWDSLAICEYLAELAPEAQLWPAAMPQRAWARSVCAEMHSGFADLRRVCSMNLMLKVTGHPLSPEAQRQLSRINALWTQCLEAHHAEGPFLFGAFSIADCFYAPVVTRIATYGLNVDGPAAAYCDAVLSWAAMREWYAYAALEVKKASA
ncbi:MAG TPA: glutathione S-transferase [Alphaproteobacteria bacterium]|nr:glutathione S-transferase [Alphaproteobacteria bacterium]HAJ45162.1 glutathione S-transferase [Alphaproteobacteria bacterium]